MREETHRYRKLDDTELTLALVRPEARDEPAPAVLFFHGGGWRMGSREQFLPQCRRLAELGAIGITATYRLSDPDEGVGPLHCIEDAEAAVRWVHENAAALGVDPARIAGGGGSAGGQMAAAIATKDLPLAALVLFNPALAPDGSPRLAFLGDECPDFPLTASFPPSLVQHGTDDRLVSIGHSRKFRDRLLELGVPCELIEYEGMPHAFFNHPAPQGRFEATLSAMERFLSKRGLLDSEIP